MYATTSSNVQYEDCPAGMHQAVCYRVIDLGTQVKNGNYGEQRKRQVLISWELPETLMEPYVDNDGVTQPARPFTMHKRYTLSFNEKANLLKDLNSWRGRPFTAEELSGPPNGFYLADVIGANCFLNVAHEPKSDGQGVWVNILAIAPLAKGMQKMGPTNETAFLDLVTAGKFDRNVFEGLSDSLKATVQKSPEWAALNAPQHVGGGAQQQAIKDHGQAPQDYQGRPDNHYEGQPTPPIDSYQNERVA